ncbi:hypothetical protein [Pseudomarimonas arenosa]|uniref:Integral membrane protein n=1 Tax=Pseudomarimonas arenosa TaxID=2774145 RepID=A0AAW3ZUN0_9GAMM|nr:hypothetical protein [Pseudomarimonas arenosa]MBD8527796.1 hypothetical protein [Pseudomarimonas arenosa]
MNRGIRRHLPWLALLSAWPLSPAAAEDFEVENPRLGYQALISDSRVSELSGLAVSRQHPDLIWVHNDGGNPSALYGLAPNGEVRLTLQIETENQDWEDLALVPDGDRWLLLIADTGDNGGLRSTLRIIAVEEPSVLEDSTLQPSWVQTFRWPDGPRDCEAMAVDPVRREILLISKKRVPPELFRLPLRGSTPGELLSAELVGLLPGVGQPDAEDLKRNPVFGRYRAQVSAADVSPDGRLLAVLNYRQVVLYERGNGESWRSALKRVPTVLGYPWLPQAEALGFLPDGNSVLIGSEKVPTPILRLRVVD